MTHLCLGLNECFIGLFKCRIDIGVGRSNDAADVLVYAIFVGRQLQRNSPVGAVIKRYEPKTVRGLEQVKRRLGRFLG